jgi:hypothetical protein
MAKKASTSAGKKPADKKAKPAKSGDYDDTQSNSKVFYIVLLVTPCLTKGAKGKNGLKPATAVNVRHILCEKHSRATEALQRLQVTSPAH